MNREIERKFIIHNLPKNILDFPCKKIQQGYIAVEKLGNEVRIRSINDQHFLTVKSSGNLKRKEFQIALSKKQFKLLWSSTKNRRLTKKRFLIPYGDHNLEIDVFENQLEGLIIAEIEFNDEEEANQFIVPRWFKLEVTNNPEYKNKNLCSLEDLNVLLNKTNA